MSINKLTSPTSSESIAATKWNPTSTTATADQKAVGHEAQQAVDFANNIVNPDSAKLAAAQKALTAGTGTQQAVDQAKYTLDKDTQELHGLEQAFWKGKLQEDQNWVSSGGGQQATDTLQGDQGAYQNFLNNPDYLQDTQDATGAESNSASGFTNADITANGGQAPAASASADGSSDLTAPFTPGPNTAPGDAASASQGLPVRSDSVGSGSPESVAGEFSDLKSDYQAGKPINADLFGAGAEFSKYNPTGTVADFKSALSASTSDLPADEAAQIQANAAAMYPDDSQTMQEALRPVAASFGQGGTSAQLPVRQDSVGTGSPESVSSGFQLVASDNRAGKPIIGDLIGAAAEYSKYDPTATVATFKSALKASTSHLPAHEAAQIQANAAALFPNDNQPVGRAMANAVQLIQLVEKNPSDLGL